MSSGRIAQPGQRRRCTGWLLVVAMAAALLPSIATSVPAEAAVPRPLAGCPAPKPTGSLYVALGDSYSAGEGLSNCYLPGTDQQTPTQDTCHRSTQSYAELVLAGRPRTFVACSGATIADIRSPNAEGNATEGPQLDSVKNPATEQVSLTIGGNDIGFANIAKACASVAGLGPAYPDQMHAAGQVAGHDCAGWESQAAQAATGIGNQLYGVYTDILSHMNPRAMVAVATYPELFPTSYKGLNYFGGNFCGAARLGTGWIGFTNADANAFRTIEGQLNDQIRATIQAIRASGDMRIRLVDLARDFPKQTIPCGNSGQPTPYVNGIVWQNAHPWGQALSCFLFWPLVGCPSISDVVQQSISTASFHPRKEGQAAFAPKFDGKYTTPVPLSIIQPRSTPMFVGVPETIKLSAVGTAIGPSTWTATTPVPPGLTIDTGGTLSGTPTAPGTYSVTIKVQDARRRSVTRALSMTILGGVGGGGGGGNSLKIAAGADHTCALMSSGTVECWGSAMGNGTTTDSLNPVTVNGISGATTIAAGNGNTCALVAGGAVECWGFNGYGKLGNGSTLDSATPVAVSGLTGATAIAAGGDHTCALMSSGAVECWGDDVEGQLGDGNTYPSSIPVAVRGLTGATAIAAGYSHTCALLSDGSIECWGSNISGALGNGTTIPSLTPTPVNGLTGATSISARNEGTCAIVAAGAVECWGYNENGQLGNGTATLDSLTPTPVSGVTGAVAIASGDGYSCALVSGGALECWGYNGYGNGPQYGSLTPTTVSGLTAATAISSGLGQHTCALVSGGSVDCWGLNNYGQLGDGTTTDSWTTPVAVKGL